MTGHDLKRYMRLMDVSAADMARALRKTMPSRVTADDVRARLAEPDMPLPLVWEQRVQGLVDDFRGHMAI